MEYPSISGLEVKSVIGQGGMGTVYCAVREEDSALVALKVLHPHLAAVPEFVKRFHREARVAEKLAHPRVARVLTSGEEHGTHYIVMELVRGGKLSQRLARNARRVPLATLVVFKGTEFPEGATTEVSTPLAPDAVIKMMRQIAAVLEEAHQIGLVHRDIKPDNIIVDNDWNVKLLDFGIAKDTQALDSVLSQTGQTFGTPPYMSPEQCKAAKDLDTRSDLYSLGVVAYHCLSGHTPFAGPTTAAFINQHINDIPRSLHEVNPKIPRNLSLVIDRLLAKDPKERHQTPNELIEDLNRVERGGRPLRIYHPKKSRAFSSKQVIATAAISAAIVILSVIVVLYGVPRVIAWIEYRGHLAEAQKTLAEAQKAFREALTKEQYEDVINLCDKVVNLCDKALSIIKDSEKAKNLREQAEELKRIAEFEKNFQNGEKYLQTNDLRNALLSFKEAVKYNNATRAQEKVVGIQLRLSNYDANLEKGRKLLPDQDKLHKALNALNALKDAQSKVANLRQAEEALNALKDAQKSWDTQEVQKLIAQAEEALNTLKDAQKSWDTQEVQKLITQVEEALNTLKGAKKSWDTQEVEKLIAHADLEKDRYLLADAQKAFEEGRYQEAVTSLEKAVLLKNTEEVRSLLDRAKTELAKYQAMKEEERKNEDKFRQLLAAAKEHCNEENAKKAFEEITEALKIKPNDKEALALETEIMKLLFSKNSIGMEFVLIPKGEFMMGSPNNEGDSDEHRQHKVKITKRFYMQTTEVTQKQWEKIMHSNPSNFKGDDLPVENVSWEDVQEFIKKLPAKEGVKYRLPTEAEWEYACRAGSTTRFCFGDDDSKLVEYAWYSNNSDRKTHDVGKKKANSWGLYDMHGNVWEWCQDWYGADYYKNSPAGDPQGPKNGQYHVVRGGSWLDLEGHLRSADRSGVTASQRNKNRGFRVAGEILEK